MEYMDEYSLLPLSMALSETLPGAWKIKVSETATLSAKTTPLGESETHTPHYRTLRPYDILEDHGNTGKHHLTEGRACWRDSRTISLKSWFQTGS